MANPIFIEYYPHEQCDCYKVKNPWTDYAEHKIVLCKVSDGSRLMSDVAKRLQLDIISELIGV